MPGEQPTFHHGDQRASIVLRAAELAASYLAEVPDRPVRASMSLGDLRRNLGGPFGDQGVAPESVLEDLAQLATTATVATSGPRYFGFVTGGALPVALGAEILASAWDQNAAMAVMSPLASVVEEVAGAWIVDLLGLPATTSIGFVTGGQSANTTCLAAARQHVLAAASWDVGERGLNGAPPLATIVGEQRHATVDVALRLLGLGAASAVLPADPEGRMLPSALADALAEHVGPAIVCLQAGNVNSGAFDDFPALIEIARRAGAWVHIDGAFGLWAAVTPNRRHLVAGMELADSWATDGHKWLNVPYDCGYALTAHPESHRAANASSASYYVLGGADAPRDGMDWVPEASRRARGLATYAALASLGRSGVAELVERCCSLARRLADLLEAEPGIEILNDVVLNQVVVTFGAEERTRTVIAAVQNDGTCWAGASVWAGRAVMRFSVSNWSTTELDIDRSAQAILSAHRAI